jgi:hypothetical protein
MTPATNSDGLRLAGADRTEFQTTTLGADLLLTEREDGSLELYTFDGRDARALGTYPDAAAAWRAIDALDVEDLDDELAA